MDTFASKLNRLFEKKTKSDGTQYVAEEVQVMTGGVITASHIWRLRSGSSANPTFTKIQALCDFFGVDANYFFYDEIKAEQPQLTEIEAIVQRARALSDDDVQALWRVLRLVNELREAV